MIDGLAIQHTVRNAVVVKRSGMVRHRRLSIANPLGRRRIEAPVEAQLAAQVMRLQPV